MAKKRSKKEEPKSIKRRRRPAQKSSSKRKKRRVYLQESKSLKHEEGIRPLVWVSLGVAGLLVFYLYRQKQ